jgi:hypothetical protein
MTLAGPVVVGWSGSAVSARAMAVAAEFAEHHGQPLRVVLGWDYLDQPNDDKWDPEFTAEKAQARLDAAVSGVRRAYPHVAVTAEAQLGWPPSIVADAANDAGLLVVGRSDKTRGHFGEWSPDALVRRVQCPVVWVP